MFGTLVSDLQREEPLTFVENTDPTSALRRNRRDKPHSSCELCRARKIRCSGQPSGCDRCIAISVECRYRDRISRRRRQTSSAGSNPPASDKKQQGEKPHIVGSTPNGRAEFQENGKEGLDDWSMDINDLLDPMFSTQLGSPNNSTDMVSEITWETILNKEDSGLGPESVEFGTSNGSIPSCSSFEQLLAPSLDFRSVSSSNDKLEVESLQLHGQRSDPALNEAHQQPRNSTSQRPSPITEMKSTTVLLQSATGILSANDQCRCRKLTATLFEELCAESANSSQAAMDVLLRYFRGALAHCTAILDCDRCSASASDSSNNMLLAMAGQYMSTICERIAMCYAHIRRQSEERQRSISVPLEWGNDIGFINSGSLHGLDDSSAADGDMWFSTYRIESSQERMQVLRCIVTVQLSEFTRVTERLKSRASSRSGYLVLLADMEKRIRSAKSILINYAKPIEKDSFKI
ncbi:hypothetical protein FB567DRAFT_531829 [Paraphoma chrysanthemicola]|uniref:Zn(2)-C6 fungal-type domain-containing protein n=1 Tax=Paraphoma chrysanthemicola TaxID=798071 RepID=A0A8K0R1Q1_9PLEO|nr:hypothetical protein FB567DRAFT_531829 [Paraphoma chrysanthemicola]